MQNDAAFHQGLHSFLRFNQPSGTEIPDNLENSTYDPLKCKMDKSILIVSIYIRKSEYKGLIYSSGKGLE